MENIMEIEHLSKSFGEVKAVPEPELSGRGGGAVRLPGRQWCGQVHYHQHYLRTASKGQRQRTNLRHGFRQKYGRCKAKPGAWYFKILC